MPKKEVYLPSSEILYTEFHGITIHIHSIQNSVSKPEQPEKDSQNGTIRTGQSEQDGQNRVDRTGQPERDGRDGTALAGRP